MGFTLSLCPLLCGPGVSVSLLALLGGRRPFPDDPRGHSASALPVLPEGLQKRQRIPAALHEAPGTRHRATPIFSFLKCVGARARAGLGRYTCVCRSLLNFDDMHCTGLVFGI